MLKNLDPEKRKQLLGVGAVVAAFCAIYAFDLHVPLVDAASSLMGHGQSAETHGVDGGHDLLAADEGLTGVEQMQPTAPDGAPVLEEPGQAPGSTEDSAAAPAKSESDPAALERALDTEFETLQVSEELLNEPVWRALDRITGWYSQPAAVKTEQIYSYFMHHKLWVRLAALQFVCAHQDVMTQNSVLVDTLRDKFVRGEHLSQVRRFLERARAVDLTLYQKMKEILRV